MWGTIPLHRKRTSCTMSPSSSTSESLLHPGALISSTRRAPSPNSPLHRVGGHLSHAVLASRAPHPAQGAKALGGCTFGNLQGSGGSGGPCGSIQGPTQRSSFPPEHYAWSPLCPATPFASLGPLGRSSTSLRRMPLGLDHLENMHTNYSILIILLFLL